MKRIHFLSAISSSTGISIALANFRSMEMCGSFVFIPLVILALNVALLVWVARDAKSRGMDSAVIWMVLVMFTSVIGLVIYIFSRPQGNLIQCPHCHNQRLQAIAKCPHCGNA